MAVVTCVPEPNLWKEICKAHEHANPPFNDEQESISTDLLDYDPSKHNPVFYGQMHTKVHSMDDDIMKNMDPAIAHPAAVGYAFIDRPIPSPPSSPLPPPDYKKCAPRIYLETFVFPTLMPALQNMLITAKTEKCFERKRTRFNALDYLTEQLYYNNPQAMDGRMKEGTFLDIDFVKTHMEKYPRPALPLSLLWTEEEATVIIQSWWRGYVIRRDPEVQELREWQRMWREEKADVATKVSNFWAGKMPNQSDLSLEQPEETGNEEKITENRPDSDNIARIKSA